MPSEREWMMARCGRITASELGDIMSASGRITDGCASYIRAKRFERTHRYALPVSARTMDIGNENEPMIYEWMKANLGEEAKNVIYSKSNDLDRIPFWVPEDMPFFGASPDAFTEDHKTIWEYKTLVGNEATFFFMDKNTSMVEKEARVLKEHGDQIMGLFIACPEAETVKLIKYAYQHDEVLEDTDSPLAAWRGIVFEFKRDTYATSIAYTKARIRLFNSMIDADINPSEFKSGTWAVVDGKLKKKE